MIISGHILELLLVASLAHFLSYEGMLVATPWVFLWCIDDLM